MVSVVTRTGTIRVAFQTNKTIGTVEFGRLQVGPEDEPPPPAADTVPSSDPEAPPAACPPDGCPPGVWLPGAWPLPSGYSSISSAARRVPTPETCADCCSAGTGETASSSESR